MKDNKNIPGKNRETFKHFEKMEEIMVAGQLPDQQICWIGYVRVPFSLPNAVFSCKNAKLMPTFSK